MCLLTIKKILEEIVPRRGNQAPKGEIKEVICFRASNTVTSLISLPAHRTNHLQDGRGSFPISIFLWGILLTQCLLAPGHKQNVAS